MLGGANDRDAERGRSALMRQVQGGRLESRQPRPQAFRPWSLQLDIGPVEGAGVLERRVAQYAAPGDVTRFSANLDCAARESNVRRRFRAGLDDKARAGD